MSTQVLTGIVCGINEDSVIRDLYAYLLQYFSCVVYIHESYIIMLLCTDVHVNIYIRLTNGHDPEGGA